MAGKLECKLESRTVDLSGYHWVEPMVGKKESRSVAMLAFVMAAEMVAPMESRMVGMMVGMMGDKLAELLAMRMVVRLEHWKEYSTAETKAAWLAASSVLKWEWCLVEPMVHMLADRKVGCSVVLLERMMVGKMVAALVAWKVVKLAGRMVVKLAEYWAAMTAAL